MQVQPNVLVVLSDQQRPDSCGVFGQRLPVTPVLDELAGTGVAFDHALTVQPVCGPARAALQTGRYPTEVGCWRNGLSLPSDAPTLAGRLAELGYWTGYVGKWHLASDRGPGLPSDRTVARYERRPVPPDRRGGYRDAWAAADALEHTSGPTGGHVFDEEGRRVPLHGYRVDAVTDLAIDRLRRVDDRPFLLWVSYLEPHHQNNRLRVVGPPGGAARFRDFDRPGDLPVWRGDWRWNYPDYLAACASIDRNLGRLLDELLSSGRLEDTIMVVTSDHGTHFRTRNAEYKRSPHDASIRVPLVVAGPGFRGGIRRDDLVSHVDLLPTLVTAAGGADPGLDGRPLQDPVDRDEVLVQISESTIGRALRTRTHTIGVAATDRRPFAGHRSPAAPSYRVTHLYDNVADPHQRRNLARDPAHAGVRSELADRLRHRIREVEGAEVTIRSPDGS